MKTIGLSGFAQSGKTTAANYIEKTYGFERRHIAEPLRAMLAVLMRANNISEDMIDRYLVGDLKDGVPIPELGGRTSRYLQVKIGTEFGREMIDPDLWVNTWHRGIGPGERAMNDSVRFPNEETAIQSDNGITLMICRAGTGPAVFKWNVLGLPLGKWLYTTTGLMWGVHDSERTDLLHPTAYIDNDGSLEDLYTAIDEVMDIHGVAKIETSAADSDGRAIWDQICDAYRNPVPIPPRQQRDHWKEFMVGYEYGIPIEEVRAADMNDVEHMYDLVPIQRERAAQQELAA